MPLLEDSYVWIFAPSAIVGGAGEELYSRFHTHYPFEMIRWLTEIA
jgi:hypothetical protein